MPSTQQFSVTLPDDMAAQLRAKVASGEYATEGDVLREGLRALQDRDLAIEDWIREDALAGYDAYKADPQSGLSLDQLRADIALWQAGEARRD